MTGSKERRFPPLSPELAHQLMSIEASIDGPLRYYPCTVDLFDDTRVDHVYLVEALSWHRMWGIWPEDDPGKRLLDLSLVRAITESPSRLPARFANQLYRAGESAMGATIFEVTFSDGTRIPYVTGNAVDFLTYPPGKNPADVVAVTPHAGRGHVKPFPCPSYWWCLFSR